MTICVALDFSYLIIKVVHSRIVHVIVHVNVNKIFLQIFSFVLIPR